jgi:PAS domain S-box-containing protein
MAKKPSYKELEHRVKELEKKSFQQQHTEEALKRLADEHAVLLSTVPAMIFWIDKEGYFIRVNEPFAAALKKSPDEIEGKSLFDLYPKDQARRYHSDNLEVIESGNSKKNIEEPVQTPAGTMWVCTDKIPYRDKEGNSVGIIGFSVDITERKRSEEALRKSENKYRTLLEHLPQKIFHKDRNSVYVSCNENYARDLKIKPEEIKGRVEDEFFPKKLGKKYRADDKKVMASGKIREFDEKYIQDGQEMWVHTVKTPIKDEKGRTTGVLGIFWDITRQKQAEEALRKREAALETRTRELEEVNDALRVLMKRMEENKKALEEKVSLNVKALVAPYAEKLKKSGLDAKQMAFLNILESNLNDMTSPFVHKFSSKYFRLTPAELQIAHLVKDGKTTKQIAQLLNLSLRTIESHRRNIRMKIGAKNRKANLRSLLLSTKNH